MSVIAIFSATHCNGEEVAKKVAEELSYDYIDDQILDKTAKNFDVSKDQLESAIQGRRSFFGMQDKDRRRLTSYIKFELAKLIKDGKAVFHTYAAYLLPKEISHILRIALVGDFDWRVEKITGNSTSEKEARQKIKDEDSVLFNWVKWLYGLSPWDKRLYDIVQPMQESSIEETVGLIVENAMKDILQPTAKSIEKMNDFYLAAKVHAYLSEDKQDVEVTADKGRVTVYIQKYTLRIEHAKKELKELAESVDGVESCEVTIGKKFNMPSTFPPVDFDVPKKVLLVDDEVEFVQTLSERLQTRKFDSRIAYNGEEALDSIEKEKSDVMVLDLKMPGIGGLDVLKEVKQKHPDTEVIILTGHGSEVEKEKAFELGAFAYLEKPVDINVLSETMNKAYAKINRQREGE